MTDSPTSQDKSGRDDRLIQWACQAVREAQQESRDMGVPNVYVINDKILYEWPNGELRLAPPPEEPSASGESKK